MERLAQFAAQARRRAFDLPPQAQTRAPSLVQALARPGIIAEMKPASPTEGRLRGMDDPAALAKRLASTGAAGISALTEPEHFGGSPQLLAAAISSGAPVLMKDFVVTERQLDLAQAAGASAALLILPLLTPEHSEWNGAAEAIAASHARGVEVLLEVYDEAGYREAAGLDADLIGINNRDLREQGLPVDTERTQRVLGACGLARAPVLALSGVKTAADVRRQVRAGARGVLVGTNLMRATDPAGRLRELMEGLK